MPEIAQWWQLNLTQPRLSKALRFKDMSKPQTNTLRSLFCIVYGIVLLHSKELRVKKTTKLKLIHFAFCRLPLTGAFARVQSQYQEWRLLNRQRKIWVHLAGDLALVKRLNWNLRQPSLQEGWFKTSSRQDKHTFLLKHLQTLRFILFSLIILQMQWAMSYLY